MSRAQKKRRTTLRNNSTARDATGRVLSSFGEGQSAAEVPPSDDINEVLSCFEQDITRARSSPLRKGRYQALAYSYLIRMADSEALWIPDLGRFRSLYQKVFEEDIPETFFDYLRGQIQVSSARPKDRHVPPWLTDGRMGANAWYLRRILPIPARNDGHAILIACSSESYLPKPEERYEQMKHEDICSIRIGDGEAQGMGALLEALRVAYPGRKVRVLIGGTLPQDAGTWKELCSSCHIITLGAADSNPTRRQILAAGIRSLYAALEPDAVPVWLKPTRAHGLFESGFSIKGGHTEELIKFFKRHKGRLAVAGWRQRFIILSREKGRYGNFLFDTLRPNAAEVRTATFEPSSRPKETILRHASRRHTDFALVNFAMRNPWNEHLTCCSIAGTATQGTGSACLALTTPNVARQVFLRILGIRDCSSLALKTQGGAHDLYPLSIQILKD